MRFIFNVLLCAGISSKQRWCFFFFVLFSSRLPLQRQTQSKWTSKKYTKSHLDLLVIYLCRETSLKSADLTGWFPTRSNQRSALGSHSAGCKHSPCSQWYKSTHGLSSSGSGVFLGCYQTIRPVAEGSLHVTLSHKIQSVHVGVSNHAAGWVRFASSAMKWISLTEGIRPRSCF